ncbi:MAG: hypothetical protein DRJ36_03595, partial [Thermoprotei archaeon]
MSRKIGLIFLISLLLLSTVAIASTTFIAPVSAKSKTAWLKIVTSAWKGVSCGIYDGVDSGFYGDAPDVNTPMCPPLDGGFADRFNITNLEAFVEVYSIKPTGDIVGRQFIGEPNATGFVKISWDVEDTWGLLILVKAKSYYGERIGEGSPFAGIIMYALLIPPRNLDLAAKEKLINMTRGVMLDNAPSPAFSSVYFADGTSVDMRANPVGNWTVNDDGLLDFHGFFVREWLVHVDLNGDGDVNDVINGIFEGSTRVDLNGDGDTNDVLYILPGETKFDETAVHVDLNGDGDVADTVGFTGIAEGSTRVDINQDGDTLDTSAVIPTYSSPEASFHVDKNGDGDVADTVGGIVEANIGLDMNMDGDLLDNFARLFYFNFNLPRAGLGSGPFDILNGTSVDLGSFATIFGNETPAGTPVNAWVARAAKMFKVFHVHSWYASNDVLAFAQVKIYDLDHTSADSEASLIQACVTGDDGQCRYTREIYPADALDYRDFWKNNLVPIPLQIFNLDNQTVFHGGIVDPHESWPANAIGAPKLNATVRVWWETVIV